MEVLLLWVACFSLVTSANVEVNSRKSRDVESPCTCVPYSRCGDKNINTDGSGLINLRFGESTTCKKSLEVCCKNPLEFNFPVKPKTPRQGACGKRNADGITVKIVGDFDSQAQFAEFPWMVMILQNVTLAGEGVKIYECGGSLIHEKVVLTAAHCVAAKAKTSIVLRAGDWDTHNTHEPLPSQDRYVSQVIVHEGYDRKTLENDMALLVASEPFTFADNVQIVCLPRPDVEVLSNKCWATGWGRDAFTDQEGTYQMILKKVSLPMVQRNKCETELQRNPQLGAEFYLHESFVCAGGEKSKDTCKGDGGSPLVCPIPGKFDRYQQVGIVSWGVKCGLETPGAYVNVAMLRNWISDKMKRLNLDTDFDY